MKRSMLILSLVVASVAWAAQGVEPVLLRLKLEPGKDLSYTSKTQIGQEVMGMDMSQAIDMKIGIKISKVEKGIQAVMQSSEVKMTLPDSMPMPMSAEDMQKAVESVKTTQVFNEFGKALETKVEGEAMAQAMSGTSGTSNLGFLGLEYPEKAVKVGDTWNAELDLSKVMAAAAGAATREKKVVPVVYVLTKVENGTATIEAKIKGKIDLELPNGMSANVDMDSVNVYLVDVATGIPTEMTTKANNVIDFGMGQMQQKITGTMKKI